MEISCFVQIVGKRFPKMQNSVITAGRSREVPLLLRLPGQRSREVPLLLRLPGQHSSKRTISMFRRSNRRNRTMHHNRRL